MTKNNSNKKKLGKIGEDLVEFYLRREGKKIIDRNYFCKFGEIDIVANDNDIIIFVEVRTRSGNQDSEQAIYSINKKKEKHMIDSAMNYVSEKQIDKPYRFDVALVNENDGLFNISYYENVIFKML
jgi:putative endonuclease